MIQTLMALWNRSAGGRLLVMIVTFLGLCISISLLFVTVGSVWGALLAHGRPEGDVRVPGSTIVLVTATAPPGVAPTTIVIGATPTLPPTTCQASPTETRGNTAQANATGNSGTAVVPGRTATANPPRKTPTPGVTTQPEPSPTPSPTLPVETPTVPVIPTVTAQPTVTPAVTDTPGNTPTATLTPISTSTPGATPTPTATVTDTPAPPPTGTVPPVLAPTVTVSAPAGSPTVVVSATGGITGRQVRDGRPQLPGTPVSANNGQTGQSNCLGDALVTGGEASLLVRLQDFFWTILVSSLLGTVLFCAQMYRLSQKAGR